MLDSNSPKLPSKKKSNINIRNLLRFWIYLTFDPNYFQKYEKQKRSNSIILENIFEMIISLKKCIYTACRLPLQKYHPMKMNPYKNKHPYLNSKGMVIYRLAIGHMEVIPDRWNKTQFFPSSSRVDIAIWMYYMDAN